MGRSVLEGSVGDLARYEQGLEWSLRLLERKQQGIYSMEGLGDLFAEGQDDIVSRRINLVDLVRGNLNSVVVDKNDAYTVENLGLDGVQTVLQEFQTAVSAATDIPVVVLFGKSSTGLNATGAGDLENYYSLLTRIQTRILKPALERIVSYLWAQRTLGVTAPESWRVVFNPLWVATDQEKAQAELTEAQGEASEINALIALLNASILLPEEVREVVVTEYYDDFNFQANMPEKLQELADFSHEMATTPPPDPTQQPPPGGSGGP
jgi:phage-related protein (TIGR01555 family)